jgi:glucose/arabinose dehydrogenase
LSEHQGRHDGYQPPVFAWMPSIATSNLVEVANFHERWDGDLLVTSLRAESLFRLRLDGERVLYEERLEIGERCAISHRPRTAPSGCGPTRQG